MNKEPQKTVEHDIDVLSMRIFDVKLGRDWITRQLSGRDYGIDFQMELWDGHRPTGLVLYGQHKGKLGAFDDAVKLQLPTRTAGYALRFAIPFFVFHTSIQDNKTKFIWLQEYLRLNIRSHQLTEQDSITLVFPDENTVDEEGVKKIVAILEHQQTAYAGMKFLTYYERLINWMGELSTDVKKAKNAKLCLIQILEIKKLDLLEESEDIREYMFLKVNFIKIIDILRGTIENNSISTKDFSELERLIMPLKMMKLSLLNMDTQLGIDAWLHSGKSY